MYYFGIARTIYQNVSFHVNKCQRKKCTGQWNQEWTIQRHSAQVRDTEHKSETLSTSQREKTNKTKSTTKKTKNISSTDSTKKPGMDPGAPEEPAASVTHRKSR